MSRFTKPRTPTIRREPESAGGVLWNVLGRLGIDHRVRESGAVVAWAEAVGPAGAARSRALSCRGGLLLVEVDTSPWMQELAFLSDEIRKKLNRRLGGELVREIVLKAARGEAGSTPVSFPRSVTPVESEPTTARGPGGGAKARSTR